jgi:hypothetical protein
MMSDNEKDIYSTGTFKKRLAPTVAVVARVTSVHEGNEMMKPVMATLLTVERVVLDVLKENDRFFNVEAVSAETGEPIYNFSNSPLPGDPIFDSNVLVAARQVVLSLSGTLADAAVRIYPDERLDDYTRYIDDGAAEEVSRYGQR